MQTSIRNVLRTVVRLDSRQRLLMLVAFATIAASGCALREARMSMQKVGPLESIVGKPAEFKITLNNVGDGDATNVRVHDTIPAGMSYASSSPAGRYEANERAVYWDLGTLQPGGGTTLGVTVVGDAKGEQCNQARVEADGGVSGTARSCTVVEGAAELTARVVASPDPVEVGFATTYTVEVENEGSDSARNVEIRARIPQGLAYLTASGPTVARVSGNEVSFAPLALLPPGAAVPYRLVARALSPGVHAFEAQLSADHLSRPIAVEKELRVAGGAVSMPGRVHVPAARDAGLTQLEAKDRIDRLIGVENVLVRGRAVTGRIVNRSSSRLRNVVLTVRSIWLWEDEFNPGEGDPSTSTRYLVPGEVPPGGFLPFVYRPLPLPPRLDGRYETRVSIAEFSEVP